MSMAIDKTYIFKKRSTGLQILLVNTLVLVLTWTSFAQDSSNKVITSVKFQENTKCKLSFLQTLILLEDGDSCQLERIESDIQRLKNTPGIGDAHYSIDTVNNELHLTYEVSEVRTGLPIFNFGGIKNNIWFKLGYSDINWRGLGQSFAAYYQNNNGMHAGGIRYRIPRIKGGNWGVAGNLSKWSSPEPLYFNEGRVNYDYDNHSAELSLIKHFDFHKNITLSGNFFREKYTKSEIQPLENAPGPAVEQKLKFMTKLEYNVTFLNYHFFYLNGLAWQLVYQNVYNINKDPWFNSLRFQGRKFIRVKEKTNLAMRLRMAISTNNDTPFAPFVVDSHVNIRGAGNKIDRGTAQIVFNFEYRRTVLDKKKWASQLVAFTDLGTWRTAGGDFSDLTQRQIIRPFVGSGIRIIYKKIYGAILRLDYGVNLLDRDQHGLVLGLGQYF